MANTTQHNSITITRQHPDFGKLRVTVNPVNGNISFPVKDVAKCLNYTRLGMLRLIKSVVSADEISIEPVGCRRSTQKLRVVSEHGMFHFLSNWKNAYTDADVLANSDKVKHFTGWISEIVSQIHDFLVEKKDETSSEQNKLTENDCQLQLIKIMKNILMICQ